MSTTASKAWINFHAPFWIRINLPRECVSLYGIFLKLFQKYSKLDTLKPQESHWAYYWNKNLAKFQDGLNQIALVQSITGKYI